MRSMIVTADNRELNLSKSFNIICLFKTLISH